MNIPNTVVTNLPNLNAGQVLDLSSADYAKHVMLLNGTMQPQGRAHQEANMSTIARTTSRTRALR